MLLSVVGIFLLIYCIMAWTYVLCVSAWADFAVEVIGGSALRLTVFLFAALEGPQSLARAESALDSAVVKRRPFWYEFKRWFRVFCAPIWIIFYLLTQTGRAQFVKDIVIVNGGFYGELVALVWEALTGLFRTRQGKS